MAMDSVLDTVGLIIHPIDSVSIPPCGGSHSTEDATAANPSASVTADDTGHNRATRYAFLKEELNELYSMFSRPLLLYSQTFTRERQIAQDAVQESFLRYFIYRSNGGEIVNKKGWLYKVLRNFMLDRRKDSYSRKRVDLTEVTNQPDHQLDPEKTLQEKEMYQQALLELSERELECVRLRAEGFDYQEIAELMQVRKGTVGALLARATQKVRRLHPFP